MREMKNGGEIAADHSGKVVPVNESYWELAPRP